MPAERRPSHVPDASQDADWAAALGEARELLQKGGELDRAGEVERAVEVLMQAQALLSGRGNHPLLADLLYRTGILRTRMGQTDEAEELFEQSLETSSWCEYRRGQAYAINGLAVIAQRRGDIDLALTQYRRARRAAAEVSEHRLSGMVELNLGVLANIRGDLDSAMVHYRTSLAAFERAEDVEGSCWVLNNMGMLEVDLARFEEADQTLLRGQKLAKRNRDRVLANLFELNRIEALIGLGRWRSARQSCKRVLKMATKRDDELQRAEALKYQGVIDREQGRFNESIEALNEAGGLAERTDDKLLRAEILRELGETLKRHGQGAQARLHLEYALRIFTELDAVLDAVDLRQRLKTLSDGVGV